MIEVQCTSCHTRYRIDEQVLPEGLPTFKCSRCGHVFTFEPRKSRTNGQNATVIPKAGTADELNAAASDPATGPAEAEALSAGGQADREEQATSRNLTAADSDALQPPRIEDAPPRSQSVSRNDEVPEMSRERREQSPGSQRATRDGNEIEENIAAPRPVPPRVRAKQAEKFYSQLFTGNNPEAVSGENLSFDFADEEPAPDNGRVTRRKRQGQMGPRPERESTRWEVGDEDSPTNGPLAKEREPFGDEEISPVSRRRMRIDDTQPQFTNETEFLDEEEAPVYNRVVTHSARFFVLLMFLVATGFGVLTIIMRGTPSQSAAVLSYLPMVGDRFAAPSTPAKLVALRDVNAFYQRGKDGQNTLVISGTAENVGTASLRLVQLTAALRDSERRSLASQAVYCGNSVSPGMIQQMTPHEIEFFQKLEPARTFALDPSAACRFVAVFINPPPAAHGYEVSVSQALAGTSPDIEEPAS